MRGSSRWRGLYQDCADSEVALGQFDADEVSGAGGGRDELQRGGYLHGRAGNYLAGAGAAGRIGIYVCGGQRRRRDGSGQIAARTLIETYRVDQVDAATKIYGVAGNPIKSSMSPLMMNTAFRRETVNAVYLGLQTSKAEDLFKLAREVPIQGLSITMPLKQDVMPLLERTDALSAKIGAVNTILRAQDGKFYGFNTDVAGIVAPLERRLSLKGAKLAARRGRRCLVVVTKVQRFTF